MPLREYLINTVHNLHMGKTVSELKLGGCIVGKGRAWIWTSREDRGRVSGLGSYSSILIPFLSGSKQNPLSPPNCLEVPDAT